MKIATWNVNGIRARHAQVQDWIERERPDVVCLQEIKAASDQVPTALCEMQGYWCYWHGGKGYSGVGLHVSKTIAPDRPVFTHPAFDHEHRIVAVEIGGTDRRRRSTCPTAARTFPAKMRFLEALDAYASVVSGQPARTLVLCGDLNVARTDRDVHPKERKPRAIGQLPEERARPRAHHRPWARRPRPRARSRQRRPVHVVGAVAQHARSATSAGASTTCSPASALAAGAIVLSGAERRRHERSRAGRSPRSSCSLASSSRNVHAILDTKDYDGHKEDTRRLIRGLCDSRV